MFPIRVPPACDQSTRRRDGPGITGADGAACSKCAAVSHRKSRYADATVESNYHIIDCYFEAARDPKRPIGPIKLDPFRSN